MCVCVSLPQPAGWRWCAVGPDGWTRPAEVKSEPCPPALWSPSAPRPSGSGCSGPSGTCRSFSAGNTGWVSSLLSNQCISAFILCSCSLWRSVKPALLHNCHNFLYAGLESFYSPWCSENTQTGNVCVESELCKVKHLSWHTLLSMSKLFQCCLRNNAECGGN